MCNLCLTASVYVHVLINETQFKKFGPVDDTKLERDNKPRRFRFNSQNELSCQIRSFLCPIHIFDQVNKVFLTNLKFARLV